MRWLLLLAGSEQRRDFRARHVHSGAIPLLFSSNRGRAWRQQHQREAHQYETPRANRVRWLLGNFELHFFQS